MTMPMTVMTGSCLFNNIYICKFKSISSNCILLDFHIILKLKLGNMNYINHEI